MCTGKCTYCPDVRPEIKSGDDRTAVIWRARELGAEYQAYYQGCAHGSFMACFDALREYGVELFDKETQAELFKSVIALTAGIGNLNEGTCGAVIGASFAVGLAVGKGRKETEGDGGRSMWIASEYVNAKVAKYFMDTFDAVVCRDLEYGRFGAGYTTQRLGRGADFAFYSNKEACRTAEACIIGIGAGLAAETVWDYVHGWRLDEEAIWEKHKAFVPENATEYFKKYYNCAQAVFAQMADELRAKGSPLTTPEIEEWVFKGLSGLSGGNSNLGVGNCGALSAAAIALSLTANVGPDYPTSGRRNRRWIAFDTAAKTIGERFIKEFRGLTCRAVTWSRYGMWYNFRDPVTFDRFLKDPEPNGCLCGDNCTLQNAVKWGVEYVLQERANPRTEELVTEVHQLAK